MRGPQVDPAVRTQAIAKDVAAVMRGGLFEGVGGFGLAERVGEGAVEGLGVHENGDVALQRIGYDGAVLEETPVKIDHGIGRNGIDGEPRTAGYESNVLFNEGKDCSHVGCRPLQHKCLILKVWFRAGCQ